TRDRVAVRKRSPTIARGRRCSSPAPLHAKDVHRSRGTRMDPTPEPTLQPTLIDSPQDLAETAYDLADETRVQAEGARFHLGRGQRALALEHARAAQQRAREVLSALEQLVAWVESTPELPARDA